MPQQIEFTATGTLAGCVSPTNPEITGATFTSLVVGTFSCLSGSTSNISTYHWNNGQTSVVRGGFEVNLNNSFQNERRVCWSLLIRLGMLFS